MYLAKLIRGQDKPIVTEVCSYEWGVEVLAGAERVVKRPRAPWARKTRTGAAALSHTPSGAIASAKGVLEREILKQRGDGRHCKPKYQRAHIA